MNLVRREFFNLPENFIATYFVCVSSWKFPWEDEVIIKEIKSRKCYCLEDYGATPCQYFPKVFVEIVIYVLP